MECEDGSRRAEKNRKQNTGVTIQEPRARMKEAQGSGLKVRGKETLVANALVTLMPVHKEKLLPKG